MGLEENYKYEYNCEPCDFHNNRKDMFIDHEFDQLTDDEVIITI